jgi:hypothetical protein
VEPGALTATILAEDVTRAGVLARRLLLGEYGAARVEIRENGQLLRVEHLGLQERAP